MGAVGVGNSGGKDDGCGKKKKKQILLYFTYLFFIDNYLLNDNNI